MGRQSSSAPSILPPATGLLNPNLSAITQGLRHWATLAVAPFGAVVDFAVRWLRSYFDVAQHERRAGFGGGIRWIFRNSRPVIALSLRGVFDEAISRVSGKSSDTVLAARWACAAASRCHVAQRSLSQTPTRRGDDEEERAAPFGGSRSYFDGASA